MAETLASRSPATAAGSLVQPLSGGGNESVVRLGTDVSTLLGPEGTTRGCFFRAMTPP